MGMGAVGVGGWGVGGAVRAGEGRLRAGEESKALGRRSGVRNRGPRASGSGRPPVGVSLRGREAGGARDGPSRRRVGVVGCVGAGGGHEETLDVANLAPGGGGGSGDGAVAAGSGRQALEAFVGHWEWISGLMAPDVEVAEVLRGLKVAHALFRGRVREDGRDAVAHAAGVAQALAELGMGAEAIVAGMLHQGDGRCLRPPGAAGPGGVLHAGASELMSLEEAEAGFGPTVARLMRDARLVRDAPEVLGQYDDMEGEGNPGGWGGSSAAAMIRQHCLAHADVRAVVVELCDRVQGTDAWDGLEPWRRQVLALEALQVYAPLAHALGIGTVTGALEEAALKAVYRRAYGATEAWYTDRLPAGEAVLARVAEKIARGIEADAVLMPRLESYRVDRRTKSLFSTLKKVVRDFRDREAVYDLLAVRVVLTPSSGADPEEEAELCHAVQRIVHETWDEMEGRGKDYVTRPKRNGYRSLHSTVTTEEGLPLEVQIRTEAMHAHAERGSASHGAYKGGLTTEKAASQLLRLKEANDTPRALPAPLEVGTSAVLSQDDAVDGLFDMLDVDGSGRIDASEVRAVMGELLALDVEAGEEDPLVECAAELIAAMDENADGELSREELGKFLSSRTAARYSTSTASRLPTTNSDDDESLDVEVGEEGFEVVWQGPSSSPPSQSNNAVDGSALQLGRRSAPRGNTASAAGAFAPSRRRGWGRWIQFGRQRTVPVARAFQDGSPTYESASTSNVVQQGEDQQQCKSRSPLSPRPQSRSGQHITAEAAVAHESLVDALVDGCLLPAPMGESGREHEAYVRETVAQMWALARGSGGKDGAEADMGAARRLMEQATDGSPSSAPLWLAWAELEARVERFDRARVLFEEAAKCDPCLTSLWGKYAAMEGRAGRVSSARRMYRRAVTLNSSDPITLHAWGMLEARNGNFAKAHGLLEECLRLEVRQMREAVYQGSPVPSSSFAYNGLATLAMRESPMDPAKARAILREGTEQFPSDVRLWGLWAKLEARERNADAARTLFRRGLTINPRNTFLLLSWAVMETRNGAPRAKSARSLFEQCLAVNPQLTAAYVAWGKFEEEHGRLEEAERLYRRGLEVEPDNMYALQRLAGVLVRHGCRLEQARSLLREACERREGLGAQMSAAVWQTLGKIEQDLGNTPGAGLCFAAARRLDRLQQQREAPREGAQGRTAMLEGDGHASANASSVPGAALSISGPTPRAIRKGRGKKGRLARDSPTPTEVLGMINAHLGTLDRMDRQGAGSQAMTPSGLN